MKMSHGLKLDQTDLGLMLGLKGGDQIGRELSQIWSNLIYSLRYG